MNFYVHAFSYSGCLLVGLLVCLKIGHAFGRRQYARERGVNGNALDGVVFALIGLLLAFSFSYSIGSFNLHRELLTREANKIGEANAILDLLPDAEASQLRAQLLRYAEARVRATEAQIHSPEEKTAMDEADRLQGLIWKRVVSIIKANPDLPASLHVIGVFSDMVGAPGDQVAEQRNHMPLIIYALIMVLSLMASLIAGYGMSVLPKIPLIRVVIYSLSVVATVYVIIDLEYPSSGLFLSFDSNLPLREVADNISQRMALR